MTTHSVEDRAADHTARADKARAQGVAYRGKESAYRLAGKIDKADAAAKSAERFERTVRTHEKAIETLNAPGARQHRERQEALQASRKADAAKRKERDRIEAERRRNDPTLPLRIYMEALDHAAELDGEVHMLTKKAEGYTRAGEKAKAERVLEEAVRRRGYAEEWRKEAQQAIEDSGRDLARERAVSIKAAKRQEAARAVEAKRLADIGMASEDPNTAGGSRHYTVTGKKGERITSMASLNALLHRPVDRTERRLEAMDRFDTLCCQAFSGLIAGPRFEAQSQSANGPGQHVVHNRVSGLAEMDDLREAIGGRNVDMLKARIHERQTLTTLVRDGYGTETTISALVVAAIDATATFFKTGDVMAARFAGNGISTARPRKAVGAPTPAERRGRANPTHDTIRAQRC